MPGRTSRASAVEDAEEPAPLLQLVSRARRGPSEALPMDLRAELEHSLGSSLGDVRIHTGSEAGEAAAALGARAFTYGQDIFFGANRYDTRSAAGRALIAHEVAHALQQRGAAEQAADAAPAVGASEGWEEIEADAFVEDFGAGKPSTLAAGSKSTMTIARQLESTEAAELGTPAPAPDAALVSSAAFRSLETEYLRMRARLLRESQKYEAAYAAFSAALQAASHRDALAPAMLLELLFAALGGVGAAVVQRLAHEGMSPLLQIGNATASDVVKDAIRAAETSVAASGRREVPAAAEPPASLEEAAGSVGATPEQWMTNLEILMTEELADLNESYSAIEIAMVDGATIDPVSLLQPYIERARGIAATPRTQQDYAVALWQSWIADHWLADAHDISEIERQYNWYSNLVRAIQEQAGAEGQQALEAKLCVVTAGVYRDRGMMDEQGNITDSWGNSFRMDCPAPASPATEG